jgi:aminocarboxymuconate-semialdehyde decarboxylase
VTIGTDYPFDMGVDDPLDRLRAAGLDDEEVDAIAYRSAIALFGDRLVAADARDSE